ncbi:hypothetical protein DFH09DRAFT_1106993 [Mycena vulgaris]|nr:hypothetical protein DFH09DRAFT_1106993 [Mycena vulgaris]
MPGGRPFKLNSNDDGLRQRQGVAHPILPPKSLDARKYFFTSIRAYAAKASAHGKKKINYELCAKEWNRTADGVLSAYAKSWGKKTSNSHASQAFIAAKINLVHQTGVLFLASSAQFPESLKGITVSENRHRSVLEINENQVIPGSSAVQLAISHSRITASDPSPVLGPSRKRRREERPGGGVVPTSLVVSTMLAPSSRVSDGPDGDAAGTLFGLDFDLD